jgi:hypothetical protein
MRQTGSKVIQFAGIRMVINSGTAIAVKNSGSLRRLMVLSFGAIVLSAEKNCASVWRAVIYLSKQRGLTPRAVDDSSATLALDNRVRTLSTAFGTDV